VTLLRDVEKHLRRTGMAPSTFGRLAMRDPSLVRTLRNGREPRAKTVARIRALLTLGKRP
jgi:tRNA-dihydrouridine synthase